MKTESEQVVLFPLVDLMIDNLGKVIEGFYPLLKAMETFEDKKSDEYDLFRKIWIDWEQYLGS